MKMNRKTAFALLALMLVCAMVMPMLTSCGGGGLELPEEEEETLTLGIQTQEIQTQELLTQEILTQEETSTQDLEDLQKDPMWDYIPPENYIDYSDNTSLDSSPNIGGNGTMLVTGGNPMISYTEYQKQLAAKNEALNKASDRRDFAEKEMRNMLSILWTPTSDLVYSYNEKAYKPNSSDVMISTDSEFAKNKISLEKGKVYQGLPYTHGSNNATAFVYGATQVNGVYQVPLTQQILSGKSWGSNYDGDGYIAYSARLGVNDSDALAWAWAPVAPSVKFVDTATMIVANGVLPVGDYKQTKDGKYLDTLADKTSEVVTLNGQDVMMKAYAKLQKADGLVTDTADLDHAMLVVSVTVKTDANGKIDPNASFVTVLEQTDANLVEYENLSTEKKAEKKGDVLVIGNLDKEYSFSDLFDKSYLPVTCKELCKDGAGEELYYDDYYRATSSYTKSTLFTGYVYSNRRVVYLTQTVTDKDGKVVMDTTMFPTERGVLTGKGGVKTGKNVVEVAIGAWDDTTEISRRYGDTDTSVFTSGNTYHTVMKALLASGEYVTVRDYEFTF